MRIRAAVAVGMALLVAGCGSTPPAAIPSPSQAPTIASDLAPFYGQDVVWVDCGNAECTHVKVPIDYANPAGGTVDLAVARVPAKGQRLGSLFVNPGGPGGSAFDYAKSADGIVSARVREAYDIVGVDPRGVGKSSPITCLTDAEKDRLLEVDGTPDDPAEEQAVAVESAAIAEKCASKGGAVAPFVGTANAARDLDIVRALVGDPTLNYLGKSYGTYLGAVYAELFPKRVGRMVLDGALPASLNLIEVSRGQAEGFDRAFLDFARDCSTQSDCPYQGTPEEIAMKLREFVAALDANPIQVGDRELNESVAGYAILSYLYFPESDYPTLRTALRLLVDQRDGEELFNILDNRNARSPDGTYLDNSTDAFYAVTCEDQPVDVSVDDVRRLADDWAVTAPMFGRAIAWGVLACNGWKAAGETPITSTVAKGSAPILVVSTKHDPATPYEWGVRLADELDNGHLLSWNGTNHTAYLEGSGCITTHVDGYLLDGTVPPEGTVCD